MVSILCVRMNGDEADLQVACIVDRLNSRCTLHVYKLVDTNKVESYIYIYIYIMTLKERNVMRVMIYIHTYRHVLECML